MLHGREAHLAAGEGDGSAGSTEIQPVSTAHCGERVRDAGSVTRRGKCGGEGGWREPKKSQAFEREGALALRRRKRRAGTATLAAEAELNLALARGHRLAARQRQLLREIDRHAQAAAELAALICSNRGQLELRVTPVGVLAKHGEAYLAGLRLDADLGIPCGEVAVHFER